MPLDLPKSYEAKLHEAEVYQRWEDAGCFKAGAGKRTGPDGAPPKPYAIAIPPPNVTGVLHIGHALNNTLQDTLIRWKRMQGFDTLWQPGTDHAGIATESVVAKQIQDHQGFVDELRAAGITSANAPDAAATGTPTGYDRDRFGREPFLRAVHHWKERSGGMILHQLKKLGSSCDWSRTRFTMDDGLSHAVRTMFKKLFDAGLIYRGARMVNWCPVQRTALSDDEVEHIEKNGHLWKLRYEIVQGREGDLHLTSSPLHLSTSQPLNLSTCPEGREGDVPDDATGGGRYIVVETTRPETFFGDTAVAVNPGDPRYAHLIGRRVRLPIIGREIPIVGDAHADPAKGSGAVKITPAHDPNDYEVGQRHRLPLVRCIGLDGRMTPAAAHYAGTDRFECRKKLVKELEASGVLLGSTEIRHSVGHSYRSHAPIEPMVTEQWFVKMAPLAERAVRETREGRLAFHPERWGKVYEHWLDNVRDWCISRQIWWGHRIPAWHCAACARVTVEIQPPTACAHCGSDRLTQDADVLDTWFSSALWPYSTLGWPDAPEWNDPAAARRFFPTSTLVTDRGIIFFWVARMVMTSLFANDVRPFSDVYIHGTVLDERGDKMSKSKGNGIDPLVMIEGGSQLYLKKTYECPGYGADAVRFTLLDMTTEGQDLKLSPAKFETGRNFANKVWNAGRFLLMNLSERPLARPATVEDVLACRLGFAERWLLDRLQAVIDDCTGALERFRFNDYVATAFRFFRDDLCDWYVEWAKHQFKAGGDAATASATVLWYALDRVLRLLHPGMPFLTEYLWQQLQGTAGGTAWAGRFLMTSEWPVAEGRLRFADVAGQMAYVQDLVRATRNIRNVAELSDSEKLSVAMVWRSKLADQSERQRAEFLAANRDLIIDRANLSSFDTATLNAEEIRRDGWGVIATSGADRFFVGIPEHLIKRDDLRARYDKRAVALEKSIAAKESRLANPDYAARAPAAQVAETHDLLARERVELANLRETLVGL